MFVFVLLILQEISSESAKNFDFFLKKRMYKEFGCREIHAGGEGKDKEEEEWIARRKKGNELFGKNYSRRN